MKVSIVQMDMEFKKVDENFKKAEKLIRKANEKSPDVICLPESWSSGFFPREDARDFSDKDGERTKSFLSGLAKELDVNIVGGSVPNIRGDKIYNTSFTFNREGECLAEYDKMHLFSYMNEDHYFEAGNKFSTFEIDGVKCGIVICYDVRFLELVRLLALENISLLFVVAQWPDFGLNQWKVLNAARAMENQIYVVANNSCGRAEETQYAGHSLIIDPFGEVLSEGSDKEEIITHEIDLAYVEETRDAMDVYEERRTDLYNLS